MIQKTWHLDMSDLNFELQPSIHIQIWRAFPTQTAPTEYSQALRRLLPNGAPDLNFKRFLGPPKSMIGRDWRFLTSKIWDEHWTRIFTLYMHTVFYNLISYDEFERKRYGNHSNYVGSSFHSCTQLWISRLGANSTTNIIWFQTKTHQTCSTASFQWMKRHGNLCYPQQHTSPTSLSICLLGFRLSWCIVQLEMTSLRRVQIADSTTSIMCGTYRSSRQWVEFL